MTQRQEQLLEHIIDGYLTLAQPISSKFVADKLGETLSPATIRNEMAVLEENGYIYQPHTSAGRVPSMAGLVYYIEHLLYPTPLHTRDEKRFREILTHDGVHGLARQTASYAHSACVVAYNNRDYYYTGFSQLFSHPEFSDAAIIHSVSESIDRLETVLPHFIERQTDLLPRIYIGKKNPLGEQCVALFIGNTKNDKTVLGLVSPIRTDYKKIVGLLHTVGQLLETL